MHNFPLNLEFVQLAIGLEPMSLLKDGKLQENLSRVGMRLFSRNNF